MRVQLQGQKIDLSRTEAEKSGAIVSSSREARKSRVRGLSYQNLAGSRKLRPTTEVVEISSVQEDWIVTSQITHKIGGRNHLLPVITSELVDIYIMLPLGLSCQSQSQNLHSTKVASMPAMIDL